MCGKHYSLFTPGIKDQIPYLNYLIGIKSGGGFIENEYIRIMDQGLCQPDPLSVTLGERPYFLLLLRFQPGYINYFVNLFPDGDTGLVQRSSELKILPYIHLWIEGIVFGKISYVSLYL